MKNNKLSQHKLEYDNSGNYRTIEIFSSLLWSWNTLHHQLQPQYSSVHSPWLNLQQKKRICLKVMAQQQ